MAERLGIGLQNQVQQFDSAWHLFKPLSASLKGVFVFLTLKMSLHCDSFCRINFETFLFYEVRLAPLSYFSLFFTKDFRKFVIYNKALYITI